MQLSPVNSAIAYFGDLNFAYFSLYLFGLVNLNIEG
jgi:hypothetical protein